MRRQCKAATTGLTPSINLCEEKEFDENVFIIMCVLPSSYKRFFIKNKGIQIRK